MLAQNLNLIWKSEWTPGVGDGQGGLECCYSWGHKDSDMTERLNWTELIYLTGRIKLFLWLSIEIWQSVHQQEFLPWFWLESHCITRPFLGKKTISVQFSSVAQSCPTLCDPMNRSTPGLPVHHELPVFTQSRVHWVSDAIQPSHPLSSPSSPAPNSSQHQSLFQWVNSSHEMAKVLEFQL